MRASIGLNGDLQGVGEGEAKAGEQEKFTSPWKRIPPHILPKARDAGIDPCRLRGCRSLTSACYRARDDMGRREGVGEGSKGTSDGRRAGYVAAPSAPSRPPNAAGRLVVLARGQTRRGDAEGGRVSKNGLTDGMSDA